ncbi:methyl-CpG-binding domain-containing protein 13-like [Gastrolobium bilobum]|uniref:methyl-CpG-binding domain-containing protein 13-like n=1 Tax=Gastrolobium bilobum TaxID=150636 RepID=UPI002AB25FF4|nr:methyl-CpG-binding domain-containing protein 13-like [Gastrolobium bilobum]
MEDPNSDDWLPPGWTVEVRVRKNGKRDKYYISPSSGLKFNSKVEVFRHLDYVQNKASIQRISHNVVVEKGIAEGLPPGWMKKTRITTKGDTIRRDPYYIDPVSGYAFRSIKGVEHYLKSGEIGRRSAFKPKDQDDSDIELKADKFSSAGVSTKPTLSVSMSHSSDFDMIVNDQQVPRPASVGKYTPMPISEHISSAVGTELTSSVLSRDESSDQKEGKDGLTGSTLVPGCTDEDAQENPVQENAETKHGTEKSQTRNRQRKYKKEINLPRRASKRLAGIKVDPVPELKTRNRPRRAAVKQSGEEETIINADKSPNILPNDLAKQCNVLGDESGNGNKVDAMFDYNLDIPLREILTDPCIAFAIQTLTGVTFETSKNSQISSETLAAAEGNGKKTNGLNDDKERCNVFSSPENYAIPQQEAGVAKNDDKANENAGSSSEKTLGISWMDPCIEFAIKTLTGTVPLDSDQNPKNCLQQQLSSSNTQHSDMALSSDHYCNQYFGTQNPMFRKSFVDPTMQHTRNVGMGNSAGARLPHCGEDRRNVC